MAQPGNYTVEWFHYVQMIAAFFRPVFFGQTSATQSDEVVTSCLLAGVGILGTAALSVWFFKIRAYNRLAFIAGAVGAGLVTVIKFRHNPLPLIGAMPPRYFHIPTIGLFWAVALCMKESPRFVATILCAVCAYFAFSKAFVFQAYDNFNWGDGARCIVESDKPCAVPINPAPWVVVAGGANTP
jgi:hypothetical protein